MKVRGEVFCSYIPQLILLLFLCLYESHCFPLSYIEDYFLTEIKVNAIAPVISPSVDPQPFLPLLAPSQLTPYTNNSEPVLSGLCTLNFSAAESMMSLTATDCWAAFAPYLANVVCCPQFHANLVILMGQSSQYSGVLALDLTHARHCLSDIEKILEAQGANSNLQQMCSIYPANLTEASCPVVDVHKFESIVDSSRLLAACQKVDAVNECCDQVCQNAILDAARKLALNGMSNLNGTRFLPETSTKIDACKNIVLRWLANKLDLSSANSVLRGLSNCEVNKGCPLVFPNITEVSKACGDLISNQTACCKAMHSYMSDVQGQSFITNLQALNCAASLGMKLQKANVSHNVYDLCHINLKDFSPQVGSNGNSYFTSNFSESGCLLPSLPSDVTYDQTSGIGFICDLNDNIAATWPSITFLHASSCNKTTKLPSLPTATSGQNGLYTKNLMYPLVFTSSLVLKMLI